MSVVSEDRESRHRGLLQLLSRLGSLHATGEYADFIIDCDGREFKVHKAIICPQSDFFKRLCDPKFKEGGEGRAALRETDPLLLEQVIRYLYTGDYTTSTVDTSRDVLCQESLPDDKLRPELENGVNRDFAEVHDVRYQSPVVTMEPDDVPRSTSPSHQVDSIQASQAKDVEMSTEPADHSELLFHINMFILADYLEISSLKEECLERTTVHLRKDFQCAQLVGPLRVALENTDSHDPSMRSRILKICSERRENVIDCRELDGLLTSHEPVAWPLLKEQDQILKSQIEDRAHRVRCLKAEVAILESRLQDKEEMLDLNVRLTQRQRCRNCSTDFDGELEQHRNGRMYFLRCKRCRCRHESY